MKPPRLVLVTRRFWPLVGSAEKVMGPLAVELAARGWEVTVLTAQWKPDWPAEISFHGCPVIRVPCRPRQRWAMLRYLRGLARWLRGNPARFDLVYVSMLKQEAYAAMRAVGARVPVVLRAEKAGRQGDCLWQIQAACGRPIKNQCLKAAALVAPSAAIQRELQAAGYPRPRIHYLPNGVAIPPPRTAALKTLARNALAEANPALFLPEGTPLAVYAGSLQAGRGLKHLIAAWERVVKRWPDARLWLAGAGPDMALLQRQIEAAHLTGRVVVAGVFEQVADLLAAADLFVLPAMESGSTLALLEAMAAGLPSVAGDVADTRALVADGHQGLLVSVEDTAALAGAVSRLLEEPDLAARLGNAARARAAAEFSLANMVDRHVTLLENLAHSIQPAS